MLLESGHNPEKGVRVDVETEGGGRHFFITLMFNCSIAFTLCPCVCVGEK